MNITAEIAAKAQENYCREHGLPQFAEDVCCGCRRNIYEDYDKSQGYSVGYAGSHMITSCPHCGRSFVE